MHKPPFKHLLELATARAEEHSERILYRFLPEGTAGEAALSFDALHRHSAAIGQTLQQLADPGDRVLLLFPPGLDLITAFFGCQYAAMAAVPAFAPHPAKPERGWPRLRSIVQDAQPRVILTTRALRALLQPLLERQAETARIQFVAAEEIAPDQADGWCVPTIGEDSLALLQYTSGWTGQPRGVMITHGNLLYNLQMIHEAFETSEQSVGVFWLPFYHDMGLIGGVLQPLYCGGHSTFLSPVAFLQRPLRWLQLISELKATISGGPNLAYDECVRRSTPAQRGALDLRSWELAFCGAEPIHAETLGRFADAFAPAGFRRTAFCPCYGLAEATLMVTAGKKQAPPVIASESPTATASYSHGSGRAPNQAPLLNRVGCGSPRGAQRVVIVDPETGCVCGEGEPGEIWVAGPSVGQGYWNRPEESATTFSARLADGRGPFLRTGDLGYLRAGELFVTGRLKDLIIIGGRNHYPQDIERSVEQSHHALRANSCAAFSVAVEQQERLVVLAEVDVRHVERTARAVGETAPQAVAAIIRAIRRAVAEEHDLTPHRIVLAPASTIPRTSSGKIQRHRCRQGFLTQDLPAIPV